MSPPSVSVVVATRNRADRLQRLLASLSSQTLPLDRFEIIVVDDASTDRTPSVLESAQDGSPARLRMLRRSTRGGPATARNQGWREAEGELVAFTDDDCEVGPGWLSTLLDASAGAPDAVIQGRTEPTPAERSTVGPFSRVLEVTGPGPFYPTCNIAYPAGLLESLGGFDEAYPLPGGEDTDLGWRARERGTPVVFSDSALVYHGVVDYGPLGKLRWANHWAEAMRVFARHPGLRRSLYLRVFWKKAHALLLLALVGSLASKRFPPALLLALPYLRELRGRCLHDGYSLGWIPYLALYDVIEMTAAVRGSARHRILVL